MRIILNSDILYTTRPLLDELPKHLDTLFRAAAAASVSVAVPRTTFLEVERHQKGLRESECQQLDEAAGLLRARGIAVPTFEAVELLRPKPLIALIQATGVTTAIEDPTYEDYRGAEARACGHLPPCPQKGSKGSKGANAATSDEMRDLVIWELSIRTARNERGAILFSRDKVHTGPDSQREAIDVGLILAKTADHVMEVLGQATPAVERVRELLSFAWPALLEAQVPIPPVPTTARVSSPAFEVDAAGQISGSFTFVIVGTDGSFSARTYVSQETRGQARVRLEDAQLNGVPWKDSSISVAVTGSLPVIASPAGERLSELRTFLEGAE